MKIGRQARPGLGDMMEPVVGADDQWALTPDDHALVMNKHRANRLGFAILLAFFRDRGAEPAAQMSFSIKT